MQSGRGDPCGRPCCPATNISHRKKELLGTPQTPRKGLPPLTYPWLRGISYPSLIVKDHNRVVFVSGPPWRLHRSEAQAPPHIVYFRAFAARSHLRPCNPVGATLAVALAARLPILPVEYFKIKEIFGDTPIPAQGATAPYVSLVTRYILSLFHC